MKTQSMGFWRILMIAAALSVMTLPAAAQTRHRADTVKTTKAPAFADLASFYASLPAVDPRPFDKTTALLLSSMPLSCMDHPQPRPNAVPYLWEASYTPVPDYETTRAFYGCYDWHSAVNSAWTLV